MTSSASTAPSGLDHKPVQSRSPVGAAGGAPPGGPGGGGGAAPPRGGPRRAGAGPPTAVDGLTIKALLQDADHLWKPFFACVA
jgi:hypothetical protein